MKRALLALAAICLVPAFAAAQTMTEYFLITGPAVVDAKVAGPVLDNDGGGAVLDAKVAGPELENDGGGAVLDAKVAGPEIQNDPNGAVPDAKAAPAAAPVVSAPGLLRTVDGRLILDLNAPLVRDASAKDAPAR